VDPASVCLRRSLARASATSSACRRNSDARTGQNVDDTGDSFSKMDRRDNNGHDRKRGADAAAWWHCSARAADIGRGQARGRQRIVRCGAQRVVCCCRFGAAESTALTGSSGRRAGASLSDIPVARITASERFAMAASAGRPARPDRKGNLLSSRIATSSGSPILDAEAVALVKRAAPFPPPPAEIADADLSFVVPIRFCRR
jgi:TonB family protein